MVVPKKYNAVSLQHGHMLLDFIVWPVSVLHTNIVFQNVLSMCRIPGKLREMLETNVVGVHAMVQGFMPLLQSGKNKTSATVMPVSGCCCLSDTRSSSQSLLLGKHTVITNYKCNSHACVRLLLSFAHTQSSLQTLLLGKHTLIRNCKCNCHACVRLLLSCTHTE